MQDLNSFFSTRRSLHEPLLNERYNPNSISLNMDECAIDINGNDEPSDFYIPSSHKENTITSLPMVFSKLFHMICVPCFIWQKQTSLY